eukprot:3495431-Pyramimonas_sp.AAC.1
MPAALAADRSCRTMTGRACTTRPTTRNAGREMAARQSGLCPGQPWARARGMSLGTMCTSIHASPCTGAARLPSAEVQRGTVFAYGEYGLGDICAKFFAAEDKTL